MGGTPAPTTQTTSTQISPQAQQLFDLAMPGLQSFAASTPKRYQGSTIADPNTAQTTGQNLALGAAGTQGQLAGTGAAGITNLVNSGGQNGAGPRDISQNFSAMWNPAALNSTIDAAVRPIQQNLTEKALPAIQGQFGIDNFGNSGRGLAEGIAVRDTNRAIGDVSGQILGNAYNSTLGAATNQSQLDQSVSAERSKNLLQALGLLPSIQGAQTAPAATVSSVGDAQQSLNQGRLSEAVNNFNFDNNAQYLQSKELLSLLGAIPGASTTTTGQNGQASGAQRAIGGAAQGAALGSMLFPGVGTGIGAAAGGLLPFLFG
jgi:hypothetical protein